MDLPKTRAESLARGLPRYFTGKPCPHGHVAERNTGSTKCIEFRRIKAREKYAADPETRLAYLRKWKSENREKTRSYGRRYSEANRENIRAKGRAYSAKRTRERQEARRKYLETNGERLRAEREAKREASLKKKREYDKNWQKENPERMRERHRRWHQNNPQKAKAKKLRYRSKPWKREQEREYNREWYKQNRKLACHLSSEWARKNRSKVRANNMKRHASKLQATPTWLSDECKQKMVDIYEQALLAEQLTGVPHHVDHIEPLQGEDRCGLHVPWNLQVLEARENISKGNRT